MSLGNDKAYLQDLLLNIKQAYTDQENLTFKIIKQKERGFSVKVGGLFAFVSFYHFGWSYPSIEFWRNVSNHMVGRYFTGRISILRENPIFILVDAKEQTFEDPDLIKYNRYRGVVLKKSHYGVFVDLGLHFNWKCGSVLGLVPKATLLDESDFDNWNPGDEIITLFQGYNKDRQLILGDNRERGNWLNGTLDELIGTVQKVNVIINKPGIVGFYVLGEYKGVIPTSKKYYPGCKKVATKYISGLKNGDIIDCEILRINMKRNTFILKLVLDQIE